MIELGRIACALGGKIIDNRAAGVSEKVILSTGIGTRRTAAEGETLFDLALKAAKAVEPKRDEIGAVIAATFSYEDRFPSLAVRIASALGLKAEIPAFDLQLACSAYPYAVYLAGQLAAANGKATLVIDGDVQTRLVDAGDGATAPLFSDAASASIVGINRFFDFSINRFDGDNKPTTTREGEFRFWSRYDRALECGESGPVKMDGFKVFSFVATEVRKMLEGMEADWFVPHQANMYMARQLARSIGMEAKLLTSGEVYGNPGSASIPLTLAHHAAPIAGKTALIAGFGAGLSAAAGVVKIADDFKGVVL